MVDRRSESATGDGVASPSSSICRPDTPFGPKTARSSAAVTPWMAGQVVGSELLCKSSSTCRSRGSAALRSEV